MTDAAPHSLDLTRDEDQPRVAVCCSGGGIRSAAFNLGALQELAAQGVLADVDDMCAVSGGSYMAASHALVGARSLPRVPVDEVYEPGSPEEKWLRGSTRYLLPDCRVALYGAVRLFFGVTANLLLILAWLFVLGHALGWLLYGRGWLGGLAVGAPFTSVGKVWIVPVALGVFAVLVSLFGGERRPLPNIAWWSLVLAVVATAAFILAPLAIKGLYNTGLHDNGNVGVVVRGVGFASPAGCAAAREAQPDPNIAVCGVKSSSMSDTASQAPENPGGQGGGFVVFVTALTAVVRLALGRLRGAKPDANTSSFWKRVYDTGRHFLLPWLGTLGALAVFAFVALRWTADGAIQGHTNAEVTKVLVVFGALVLARFAFDVNHTSMHGFYRERLAFAYGVARGTESTVVGLPDAKCTDLRGTKPNLVVCAAANVNIGIADDELPPGRDAISFTFTPDDVGLSARAPFGTAPDLAHVPGRQDLRVDMKTYERVVGRSMRLFDAVALSGAAVSPIMGKMTRPAQRFLFAIADVRLGLWLPSPRLVACAADPKLSRAGINLLNRLRIRAFRARIKAPGKVKRMVARIFFRGTQPNLRLLLAEMFGHHRVRTSWLYVTDGGHFDNLGLVEALRRGATEVYVFDASGDTVTTWDTLGQAIALARSELGVEIDIDPEVMVNDGKVVQPYAHGTYTYTWDSGRPQGEIHLCKLGVWPGAPWDVQAYADRHATFPTDSTLQQMYDDEEFEAYRALGRAATHEMLAVQQQPADQPVVSTTRGIGLPVSV